MAGGAGGGSYWASCGTRPVTCRVGKQACGTHRTTGSVRLLVPCAAGPGRKAGGDAAVPGLRARGSEAPGAMDLRSPLAAYRVS